MKKPIFQSVVLAKPQKFDKMILWSVLLVVYLLYKWSTSKFNYFAKAGVPFEKPWPLVGNVLNVVLQRESIIDLVNRSYYKFKGSK